MRVLLDESLPDELRYEITGHDVYVVRELGWSGLKNGELLKRNAGRVDVFVTADQNLEYQQNVRNLPVAVIVLIARTNRIEDLRPLIPRLLQRLTNLAPRTLVRVGISEI